MNTNNNTSHWTATVSYCKHTATKLVVSTSFKNSRTATKHNLISSEHNIFALPLAVIYDICGECTTPTEKYIAMTAYLVKLGVISTRDMPLQLEDTDMTKVAPVFREFAILTQSLISDARRVREFKDTIPMMLVNEGTNGTTLKQHLRYCISVVEASRLAQYTTQIQRELASSGMSLDRIADIYEQADSETEMMDMLRGYKSKNSRYSKQLGAWAVKQIIANTDYNSRVIEAIRNAIFKSIDDLEVEPLKRIIVLVKEGLTYEDHEREQALLVVRMLESKLEDMLSISYSFGFVRIEKEVSRNTSANVKYDTRTKVININSTVTNRNPTGATALDRLRNKFKVASTDASTKEQS
jgi:hypothetical protein